MGGRVALFAEVTGSAHNALAEVLLPDAVDDDAGGERVFRIDDGLGEIEAAVAVSKARGRTLAEDGKEVGRGGFAGTVFVAAEPDAGFIEFAFIGDGLQIGIVGRQLLS